MFRMFVPIFKKMGPPAFRRLLLELTPSPDLQKIKQTVDVMSETSNRIYRQKLEALRMGDETVLKQLGEGKDVMSILREPLSFTTCGALFADAIQIVKANVSAADGDRLPEEELIAQMRCVDFPPRINPAELIMMLEVLLCSPDMTQLPVPYLGHYTVLQ